MLALVVAWFSVIAAASGLLLAVQRRQSRWSVYAAIMACVFGLLLAGAAMGQWWSR